MKFRFSSMVQKASSVAARRMYGDFGAPLPLVVVVVVSDIDSLAKHPCGICRDIAVMGGMGRGGRTAGEPPEPASRSGVWRRWRSCDENFRYLACAEVAGICSSCTRR